MGLGDNLMAAGMAKGAAARGKRIAFGNYRQIIWDHHSETVFQGNPNIAPPGSEKDPDIEWIQYHRGHRIYNRQGRDSEGREVWLWNMRFSAKPGEIYFTDEEKEWAAQRGRGFVVIEPNVPAFKSVASNKQWPVERYQEVATALRRRGHKVIQFHHDHGRHKLDGLELVKTPTFRHALGVLANASLYIGPEGGLHHGAAAVGVPGVVLFGGFIPPAVTGYAGHTNLTGGAEACGSLRECEHCRVAMDRIGVPDVLGAAEVHLNRKAA